MTCVCVDCVEYPCECSTEVQAAKVRWTVAITALRAELREVRVERDALKAEAALAHMVAAAVGRDLDSETARRTHAAAIFDAEAKEHAETRLVLSYARRSRLWRRPRA